jgi:hypothetical protein
LLYYPEEVYRFVEEGLRRGLSTRTIFGYLLVENPKLVKEYNLNHWKIWRISKQIEKGIVEVKGGRVCEGESYVEKRNSRLRSLARQKIKKIKEINISNVEDGVCKKVQCTENNNDSLTLLDFFPLPPPFSIGTVLRILEKLSQ